MAFRLDSIANAVGSFVNSVAEGMGFGVHDQGRQLDTWQWLTRSGIAHRVVWGPPEDALAHGWRTVAGDDVKDITEKLDSELSLQEIAIDALGAARIDGGAYVWPVTDGDEWSEPIDLSQPHSITAVHVIEKDEMSPRSWDLDPGSPSFGLPTTWSVTLMRGSQSMHEVVHTSRLAYVPGSQATQKQRADNDGFGVSTLGLYLAALDDLERAWSSSATLVSRLSIWWVRIKGAAAVATGSEEDVLTTRLGQIKRFVSTRSLVPLFNDDEMGWSGPTVSGIRDLVNALAERASAVEGIPLSRLFGTPPGGLSTDDAAGQRSYGALLSRIRESKITPALLFIYAVAMGSDASRRIEWPQLDKPTAKEAAEVSLLNAQRDAVLVTQIGAVTDDEVRARFGCEQERPLPVLDAANDVAPASMDEPSAPVGLQVPSAAAGKVQDTAMNGAQIAGMLDIQRAVATKEITLPMGVAAMMRAFQMDRAVAEGLFAGSDTIEPQDANATPITTA